jgi:iron complex outermembrane receptor protein
VGPKNGLLCIAALLCANIACAQHGPSPTSQGAEDSDQKLKMLSLEELGNVRVTTVSKQPEEVWQTAAAVTVLTQDDIRRAGVSSIPELLRLVPGVEVARTQGTGWAVGIRGLNSSFSREILVMIDGRSVYTPLFEGVYWDVQDLPMDEIERIEVIRGPGGTIWGANAVNGVINIITRKSADTQGAMGNLTAGGPVQRFDGAMGYGFRPASAVQARVWVKGFNHGPERNPYGDPYDDVHQERGGFRADWQPNTADAFSASFMLYRGVTSNQIAVAQFSPSRNIAIDDQQTVSGGDLLMRWDHQQSAGSGFFAQAYFDRTNRSSTQYSESRDTFDVDLNEHWTNLSRQDIILGADMRSSPSNVYNTKFSLMFSPQSFNNYVFSLYAQDALKLIPDPHLRLEVH